MVASLRGLLDGRDQRDILYIVSSVHYVLYRTMMVVSGRPDGQIQFKYSRCLGM